MAFFKKIFSKQNDAVADPIRLSEQVAAQTELLDRLGILKPLASGGRGIRGVDGNEYAVPTVEEIRRRMAGKQKFFEQKMSQGFVTLLLVPFGMPLTAIAECYRAALQKHFDEGKLFFPKQHPDDAAEVLVPITEIKDGHDALSVWEPLRGADEPEKNALIYYPKEFLQTHGGKTKTELLAESGGWHVLLVEDMPNIPRETQAKTSAGRTQIDSSGTTIRSYIVQGKKLPSLREYHTALLTESANPQSPYYGEQFMTPEDQMMYAMTYLEQMNQVIDDFQGNGCVSWQVGAYLYEPDSVPISYWYRTLHQATVSGDNPAGRNNRYGIRPAVAV